MKRNKTLEERRKSIPDDVKKYVEDSFNKTDKAMKQLTPEEFLKQEYSELYQILNDNKAGFDFMEA